MAVNNYVLVNFTANDTDTITYDGRGLTIFVVGDFGSGNVTIDSTPDSTVYYSELGAQTAVFNWTVGGAAAAGMDIRVTLASSTDPDLDIYYFKGRF